MKLFFLFFLTTQAEKLLKLMVQERKNTRSPVREHYSLLYYGASILRSIIQN